jgi:hypothetical protein
MSNDMPKRWYVLTSECSDFLPRTPGAILGIIHVLYAAARYEWHRYTIKHFYMLHT